MRECRRVFSRRSLLWLLVLMISGITMRGTGIFCNLLAFLRWVDFAQRMGYIPVIDMQNVENLYLEDELLGFAIHLVRND